MFSSRRPASANFPGSDKNYNRTSNPLRLIIGSKRRAAPRGIFSPFSHFCTVETLALRSVPKWLRYFLQRDTALQGTVLRIFLSVVERCLREHSRWTDSR